MFIRAYLRASTSEQDATRADAELSAFVRAQGAEVAAWYVENASGAASDRKELHRLLSDSQAGDVLLVESIDRLTRLSAPEWGVLRSEIENREVRIVAMDLPSTFAALSFAGEDEFTSRILEAINRMLLDMVAAIARKDYVQRRQRQAEGIKRAKARGVYRGRPADLELHSKISDLLELGVSVRKTAKLAGCSPSTVQRVKAGSMPNNAASAKGGGN